MKIYHIANQDWRTLVEEADFEDVPAILKRLGMSWEVVKFQKTSVIVAEDNVERYVIDPKNIGAKPALEWLWSINDWNLKNYIQPLDFEQWFWSNARHPLYHGTTKEKVEDIKVNGLQPMADTRGIENRHTPPAVFASESESSTEAHGEIVVVINVALMKQDGYMPSVERESSIEYGELREAIARRIGLEDFQTEYEAGIEPDTVVIFGPVPPKYLLFEGRRSIL